MILNRKEIKSVGVVLKQYHQIGYLQSIIQVFSLNRTVSRASRHATAIYREISIIWCRSKRKRLKVFASLPFFSLFLSILFCTIRFLCFCPSLYFLHFEVEVDIDTAHRTANSEHQCPMPNAQCPMPNGHLDKSPEVTQEMDAQLC